MAMHSIPFPLEFLWIVLGIGLLAATICGFAAGIACAPWFQEYRLRNSIKKVDDLYRHLVDRLKKTDAACQLMKTANWIPNSEQSTEVETLRIRLTESLKVFLKNRERPVEPEVSPVVVPSTQHWIKTPLDASTGLPLRTALQKNLENWLQNQVKAGQPGALLIIRMDNCDQLRSRYGPVKVETLRAKLANVLVRSFRDEDLTCRFGEDTFAIIIPGLDLNAATALSEAGRQAVRTHHFRYEDDGPEVLVTASFGLTECLADDHADLAIDRANDAAGRARSAGRNQMRVFGGHSVATC